jgi:hypothetical protein
MAACWSSGTRLCRASTRRCAARALQRPTHRPRSLRRRGPRARVLRAGGYALRRLNARIAGEEADLSWAAARVLIEVDGRPFHLDVGEDARKRTRWVHAAGRPSASAPATSTNAPSGYSPSQQRRTSRNARPSSQRGTFDGCRRRPLIVAAAPLDRSCRAHTDRIRVHEQPDHHLRIVRRCTPPVTATRRIERPEIEPRNRLSTNHAKPGSQTTGQNVRWSSFHPATTSPARLRARTVARSANQARAYLPNEPALRKRSRSTTCASPPCLHESGGRTPTPGQVSCLTGARRGLPRTPPRSGRLYGSRQRSRTALTQG